MIQNNYRTTWDAVYARWKKIGVNLQNEVRIAPDLAQLTAIVVE